MSDWKDDILVALLDCGYGDIYILDDCKYDMYDIVEECQMNFGKVNINLLCSTMFDFGLRDIETEINDRICEIEAIEDERDLEPEEIDELEKLRELDPFEDMNTYHNFIDTHIWICEGDKAEIYTTYLQHALDHFCDMTGYEIRH